MKLIIDIDENDYELFKNSTIKPDWDTMWHGKEKDKEMMFATVRLIECLKNGTLVSTESDLISRSNLRAEVQRINQTYTEMSANQLGYDILRAIDTILAVELGRSQDEWIPASERLPEENICDDGYHEPSKWVLVQARNGHMYTTRYWTRDKKNVWTDLEYPDDIIAWRPLPESYKEGGAK